VRYTPDVFALSVALGSPAKALEFIAGLPSQNTRHLIAGNAVKLFADGAFFSQRMQMSWPGYMDGHKGEWLTAPEQFETLARLCWHAEHQIHVHTNGDLGLDLVLDTLEKLWNEQLRINHRFTIEHFGCSTPEQCRRIADLGALVSANVFYLYDMGAQYTATGLGAERASQMARVGTLARNGVTTTYHSDFPMAPQQPLMWVWGAVNRFNLDGAVMAPEERVTVDQALRAITVDAAYVLHMENEIGSIRAGKLADFTVLEQDPTTVPPEQIKDIKVWGTVFEGQVFPVVRQSKEATVQPVEIERG
jgi:predicted amidohydrolase YtcJ